ncbi:hypothetical protein CON36_31240 [Bacillus cereus]|uniref:CwlT-like lysozyme domain-containing protein n=2 Tax=Bacillus cereus group TaxID=86661 RepID=A0A9X6STI1_BACCE|nr:MULTISPECIES: lysozyme family protein [Bacillus cereus group]PDZ94919.1 hypothetical protein CON36_31240 [Bacillus cereus]PFJ38839.1 hypothetical protein COJ15_17330 [Bacillus thuringiensis]
MKGSFLFEGVETLVNNSEAEIEKHKEVIFIINAISGNRISSMPAIDIDKDYAQIKKELSATEDFERVLYQQNANSPHKVFKDAEEEIKNAMNNTSNIPSQNHIDFGTKITPESAYKKYGEGNETSITKQNEKKESPIEVTPPKTETVQKPAEETQIEKPAPEPVPEPTPISPKPEEVNPSVNDYYKNGHAKVTGDVERYRSIVEREASKYGLQDYTDVLLSLIMQESSGTLADVMQSSESAGLKPGAITDPEKSIVQGLKHFSSVFKSAEGDIPLTLQSYNFGGNFIRWLKKNGLEGYSPENAQAYSKWLKQNFGMTGDPKYVQHVLRYYEK